MYKRELSGWTVAVVVGGCLSSVYPLEMLLQFFCLFETAQFFQTLFN